MYYGKKRNMKIIHKITALLASYFVFIMMLAPFVFAQTTLNNPLKARDFASLVQGLADILIKIGIPLVGIFIVYAGFLFVTAGGDERKLESAKTTFYWTIIGGAVLLGSSALAEAVVDLVKNL